MLSLLQVDVGADIVAGSCRFAIVRDRFDHSAVCCICAFGIYFGLLLEHHVV